MVAVKKKYKPVQGGFLVIRPSMDVYNEFKAIVKKGDFRKSGGWGGSVGPFYGSMTFQGIMPYYYDVLHPGEAIELNRCVVNQMCDNPRDAKTVNDIVQGNCRTGESPENCEDCRSRPIEDVITTHYTLCQKPWLCIPQDHDMIQQRLCRKLHHEWYVNIRFSETCFKVSIVAHQFVLVFFQQVQNTIRDGEVLGSNWQRPRGVASRPILRLLF